MKRAVRNTIPQANSVDPISDIIHKHDSLQKTKIKVYADNKRYIKPCDISPCDAVLVKKPFNMVKGSTVYNPSPMTVVQKKGSMITARNKDSCYKKFLFLQETNSANASWWERYQLRHSTC